MQKIILFIAIFSLFSGCAKQPSEIRERVVNPPMVNGKLNGIKKVYNFRNKLIYVIPYKNGVIHGQRKYWVYGGQTQKTYGTILEYYGSGTYNNGKVVGISKAYYSNGRMKSITEYKSNGNEYESRKYKNTGHILELTNYKNGKKNGIEKRWNEYGNPPYLSFVKKYKNGNQHGIATHYYKDGSVNYTEKWDNGTKVSASYDEKRIKAKSTKPKKTTSGATSSVAYAGRPRITNNDGKFIGGVCGDGSSFFVEVNGPLFQGSGTNGVCTKTDLGSTISCVCSGG